MNNRKILKKRVFATVLMPTVALSAMPSVLAVENQVTVEERKAIESSANQEWFVGEDNGVARIGSQVYNSLAEAIEAAQDGDTVIINAGTYSEPIVLGNKSITLEGVGNHETTLTGGITFKDEAYDGANITIRNLNFKQKGIQFKVGADKDLSQMEGLTIENNRFEDAANGASMYAIYIMNTNNAMNGLSIRNNEIMFAEGTGTFLGGLCAAVCGTAEITGNIFKNMPFNAITLYGVESGEAADKVEKLTISNNTFEQWGFNTETGEGRAMRLSGVAGEVDLTQNKYVCDNMPEEYIKITDNQGKVDMSNCYWNGENAVQTGFVSDGSTSAQLICNGDWTLNNYYVDAEMKELKHEAKIGETVYSSLEAALKAAKDGDTVVINAGTYSAPIVLDSKSITLEGTGNHETILTGGITFKDEAYDGSNITIKNLRFEQKGIQFKVGADKDLSKMTGFTVENNEFENAANGASMYALYIVNTNNAMNGLVVRNNNFKFDEGTKTFLGGLCAAVCGKAEITGNTFDHMPFNAITLYGVESGANADKVEALTISNNTFNQWGFNTETGEGRAMRLSGVAGEVDLTNNKFVCDAMPEEYIKITGNQGHVDMSKCYWNGEDATVEGFVSDGKGELPSNCEIICDGSMSLENYFVADTMRDPEDLNTYEEPKEELVFSDVENHWAKDDISYVVERGLFNGTGDGTFSPNVDMTRGTFVMVLGRLAGVDVSQYTQSSYSDVESDAYYMGYVEWASENNLVNGIGNGKFAPNQGISREQVAVVLTKYAKEFGYDLPTHEAEVNFKDSSKISSWAKDAVKSIQMAGIMSGKKGNNFAPKDIASRAEVATVTKRFIELVVEA